MVNGSLAITGGGTLSLPLLASMLNGGLTLSGGGTLSLPLLQNYVNTGCPGWGVWQVSGSNSVLVLAGLTNVAANGSWCAALSIQALAGGKILLTNVVTLDGNVAVLADGEGSVVDLSALGVATDSSGGASFTAQNQGMIDLHMVQSIAGYGCKIVSDGTGSVIDLSSLSAFATPLGASELTAKNGGVILLPSNVFLFVNVAVNVAGNPVLPPVVSPGAAVSLYGRAWHSYWVEQRNPSDPASQWELFMRVPLTNDLQVISGPPQPWQAFRVSEFVADPAIVDLNHAGDRQVQLVLYGAPPKSFAVQTTDRLDLLPAAWSTWATTGTMTNSFRLFPPFTPPTNTNQFYRAKEL